MTIHSGQPISTTGWFVDPHGHQLFLRRGQLAPICPRFGPVAVWWRLWRQVGGPGH